MAWLMPHELQHSLVQAIGSSLIKWGSSLEKVFKACVKMISWIFLHNFEPLTTFFLSETTWSDHLNCHQTNIRWQIFSKQFQFDRVFFGVLTIRWWVCEFNVWKTNRVFLIETTLSRGNFMTKFIQFMLNQNWPCFFGLKITFERITSSKESLISFKTTLKGMTASKIIINLQNVSLKTCFLASNRKKMKESEGNRTI